MTSGIKLSFAMLFFLFYAFMVTGVLSQAPPTPPISLTVDQSGNGDYTKIQDAIDAVPSNNAARVSILVRPGVYQEKIYVPVDKPFITMSGTNAEQTIVTWNQAGWINQTAVFAVWASDFTGRQLTIQVYIYISLLLMKLNCIVFKFMHNFYIDYELYILF